MALCFASVHRTETLHLDSDIVLKAADLASESFFPTYEDSDALRDRMATLVQRIVTKHISSLQHLRPHVKDHIRHRFTERMQKPSHIINLGVVDADPSSTAGTIDILQHLSSYVPVVEDRPHTIPCNGDGLSMERMIHARMARARSPTLCSRFCGLLPTPQEFHKEGILLQVSCVWVNA